MPRSKDELKQYALDLAKEKGLTEAQTKIGLAVMLGDKDALKDIPIEEVIAAVQPMTDLAVGRQSDYSRAMGEAKARHDKAVQTYNENVAWRTKAAAEYQQANTALQALQTKVDAWEKVNGPLDEVEDIEGGKSVTARGKTVRTEDIEKLRNEIQTTTKAEMSREFLAFELERSDLEKIHFQRFKEPLDTKELMAVVARAANDPVNPRQISLTDAHNELYGEKIREQDTVAEQAKIKAAEDRGASAERKRLAPMLSRSGATVPEDAGVLFSKRKEGEGAIDPNEAASLFDQDFQEVLTAANANTAT